MPPNALLLASFSLSGLIANLSGSFVVSDTSQVTSAPAIDHEGQALDLETLPLAQQTLSWPESSLLFSYGPRLLLRDAEHDADKLLLHVVHAEYTYTGPRSRLVLGATGNFGRQSLSVPALVAAGGPAPAPAPAPEGGSADGTPQPLKLNQPITAQSAEIRYGYAFERVELSLAQTAELTEQSLAALALTSPVDATLAPTGPGTIDTSMAQLLGQQRVKTFGELTSATLGYAWTRRWRSSLLLSYGISGGLDDDAQEIVPQQRTATSSATVTHALTKRDDLSTNATLAQTEVSTGSNHWIATLSETWQRRWSPDVGTFVLGGVTVTTTRNVAIDGTVSDRVYDVEPTVAAGVDAVVLRERETTLSLHAAAVATPGLTALTGELQNRVGASVGAALHVIDTTVTADADATQSLPPDDAGSGRVLGVGAAISQDVEEYVFVTARYRSIWQDVNEEQARFAINSLPHLWTAIFTVTLRAPSVDF